MIVSLLLLFLPLVYCNYSKHPFFRKLRVIVLFFGDNWAFIPDYSDSFVIGF